MDGLVRVGRLLYAVAMLFFGMQCLNAGSGKKMWMQMPGPPWTQTEHGLALMAGLGLIVMAICLLLRWYGRAVANLLGVLVLLRALLIYLPHLIAHPHDPRPWTSFFELAAIAGAALVMGGTFSAERAISRDRDRQWLLVECGRWLFAISLIVFGVQHLMYAGFVAALVPAWIPGHLFWAYFTGICFLVAAASLLVRAHVELAGGLLGAMFLLWVFVVHMPRVAKAPFHGDEWTSEFVALAMSGASFVLAGTLRTRS